MVHHICLLETKSETPVEKLEEIMVETRIRLLKIAEINNLHVGKRIDTGKNPFQVFFSFDIENLDKLKYALESAIFTQFEKQIVEANVVKSQVFNYEMEPGKDVKYS